MWTLSPRGPDWMPITPKTGSLFHAETHADGLQWRFINAAVGRLIPSDNPGPGGVETGVPEFIDRQMESPYGHAGAPALLQHTGRAVVLEDLAGQVVVPLDQSRNRALSRSLTPRTFAGSSIDHSVPAACRNRWRFTAKPKAFFVRLRTA